MANDRIQNSLSLLLHERESAEYHWLLQDMEKSEDVLQGYDIHKRNNRLC